MLSSKNRNVKWTANGLPGDVPATAVNVLEERYLEWIAARSEAPRR